MEKVPIFVGNQVDSDTEVAKASRAANAMQVGLCHFGKVKVDNNIDRLNVNTTSKEITANKVTAEATPEVVKNAVSVWLRHSSVNIVTGITKFGNLLREQFNTLSRVAEDNGLVDLKFRK